MIISKKKFWQQFTTIILIFALSSSIGIANFVQADSPVTLSVNLSTYQGTVSTVNNYLVVAATVKASGSPVSGAIVTFSDSRSSTFNGQTANTNSSGIALTTVQFNNNWNSGIDIITASATATGYNPGFGSENITLLPGSGTQLYVTPSLANKIATGGSTNVISGTVAFYGGNALGATVTFSDTIGSTFSSTTVSTNNNGFFSTNFTVANIGTSTLDFVTVGVASNGYSPSQSTIVMQVNPYNFNNLTVTMNTFYPSTTSTPQNYMVIEATVTAGGTPVSGALVAFSDSRGSSFNGQTANTNSSGIALTTVQFNNNWNSGIDIITASATATGYSASTGSNIVTLLPGSGTQLYVTPSLANKIATGGSTNVISGTVAFYGGNALGATVTFSDTIGSTFSSTTVSTNNNGFFSTNFTVANIGTSTLDFVTVGVASNGYSPSQSTIVMQVNPYNFNNLTVTMNTFYPSTTSTPQNYMVIEATVTAGGTPVSGALVAFSDSRGSSFNGQTANTNSSGIALTTVQFNNNWNSGIDIITASATATGYSASTGSNIVTLLPGSGTQLYVTPSLANKIATGGSTNVISGTVAFYGGNALGATVTFSDTIGSTFNVTSALTDKNGYFSASFIPPITTSTIDDLLTVSTSESGYSGSTSTIYMQVIPATSILGTPRPTPITAILGTPTPTPITAILGTPTPTPITAIPGTPTPTPITPTKVNPTNYLGQLNINGLIIPMAILFLIIAAVVAVLLVVRKKRPPPKLIQPTVTLTKPLKKPTFSTQQTTVGQSSSSTSTISSGSSVQQSSFHAQASSKFSRPTSQTPLQSLPTSADYRSAFTSLKDHMLVTNLISGQVELNNMGLPVCWSGNYAIVFKVSCAEGSFAVRCFKSLTTDETESRYRAISEYLGYGEKPLLIHFKYEKQGFLLDQKVYPILTMDWVNGQTLHEYINRNYNDPVKMELISNAFIDGIIALRRWNISHGDLSSDNIMVENNQGDNINLKLVDYDSIYIPDFKRQVSSTGEIGKAGYQHPNRKADHYSERTDNFSCLVIYLSLLAISKKPGLWEKYNDGEDDQRIILSERDLKNPTSSSAISEIEGIVDEKIKKLVQLLKKALSQDPLWNGTDPDKIKTA